MDPLGGILSGGAGADLAARIGHACAATAGCSYAGDLETVSELEVQSARLQPQLILLPVAWLKDAGLDLLERLESVAAEPGFLFFGDKLCMLAIAEAIPLGFRGLLARDASAGEIARAFAAIRSGELWLSRRHLLKLIMLAASREPARMSATWRNLPSLTEREHAVLSAMLEGHSNKGIGRKLEISEQTVKVHLQHIFRKLGVRRRVELLRAYTAPRAAL